MDELLTIRRSITLTLMRNAQGDMISMRSMIPVHEVKTVKLNYHEEEATEAQWVHWLHAQSDTCHFHTRMNIWLTLCYSEYVNAMRDWANKNAKKGKTTMEISGPGTNRWGSAHFSAITGPLRWLTMVSASVLLNRFNRTLWRLRFNTLVNDMNRFWVKGLNAHHFIDIVKREGDPLTITELEKLQFLTYGSLTLTYIFYQLHTYVLPRTSTEKPRKLLVTEDIILTAWFWSECCKLTYVEAEVLHAGLMNLKWINLFKRFNDFNDSLIILIIMYQVSAQGVNLNTCCSQVLVATPGINAPVKIQACGRVIRVGLHTLYWYEKLTSLRLRYHRLSWSQLSG